MKQLTTKSSKWNTALKGIGAIVPAGALALGLVFSFNAAAVTPSTVVVTPDNTQGWSTADTRPGGSVEFVEDTTSPYPSGALQLTTDATTTAKAQYLHAANTPLSEVTELSYSTKQVEGPVHADPSYQLVVDLNGDATGGFTTFVYEPYQQSDPLVAGDWQTWNVADGQLWSSRSFSDGADCNVVAGGGGAPFYTLSDLQTDCPDAVAIGFGVNIGVNNPGYVVEADSVNFNGITYDFEVAQTTAAAKEACKNGGYQVLVNANGDSYKNQGQCVADVVSNSNSKTHRS